MRHVIHPIARIATAAVIAAALVPLSTPVVAGAAHTAAILADVNPQPPPVLPSELAEVGGSLFFAGQDAVSGDELWRVDPATGQASHVRDLHPGSTSSSPKRITELAGTAYFTADDGVHGRELWRSSGTAAGTVMVADLDPGAAASDPLGLLAVGRTLYFEATDGVHGRELWRSDGTSSGTVMVEDIDPGPGDGLGSWWDGAATSDLTAFGGRVYFGADDGVTGWEPWSTDGTSAGTALLLDINAGAPSSMNGDMQGWHYPEFEVAGGVLYLAADDGTHGYELWRSDGTAGGTSLVRDVQPGTDSALASGPYASRLTASGPYVYFQVNNWWEVWRSDGTAAGTIELMTSWNPKGEFTDVGGVLYFTDWFAGLWRSDGTPAGTVALGAGGYSLMNVAGTLYFRGAADGELWTRDVSGSGVSSQVTDLDPTGEAMPLADHPWWFTGVGTHLYFVATDGQHGRRLYRSDGTSSGTALVGVPVTVTLPSSPGEFTVLGATTFFTADDGTHGSELWATDGTTAGTALVRDVRSGVAGSAPAELVSAGGRLLFTADDGVHGRELWACDGTAAGTFLVADLQTAANGHGPLALTAVGDGAYFVLDDAVHGAELWRSDGTTLGTGPVADVNPGPDGSDASDLTDVAGALWFTADDGTHGRELWRSDGTAAGTTMVKDIVPGLASGIRYTPAWIRPVGSTVFFAADDGAHGTELWRSDGTSTGTSMVADVHPGAEGGSPEEIRAFGSDAVFSADDGVHGRELWRSDGTAAGTTLVADVLPGTGGSYPSRLTPLAGRLAFTADDVEHGGAVWTTDGTAAGTSMLADLYPGSEGSPSTTLVAFGPLLYFVAGSEQTGLELYRARLGTPGATLVADVAPGATHSDITHLTAAGKDLLFSAADGVHGAEPWVVADAGPDVVGPVVTATPTPAANPAGWWHTPVTFSFTCVDASGVAVCPGPVTVATEGAGQSVSVTATDADGNMSVLDVTGVDVDLTGPVLTVAAPTTVGPADTVTITCSASDALSGVTARSCGSLTFPATELRPGANTFSFRATDVAGNTATTSVTVALDDPAPVVRADLGVSGLEEAGFRTASVRVGGSFTDPSGPAPYTAAVRWSFGTRFAPVDLNGRSTFSFTHTYASAGNRVVTVRICDGLGVCGTDDLLVHVGIRDRVAPVSQCVVDRGPRVSPRYLARWGYRNPAAFAVAVPTVPRTENTFTTAPYLRGQPEVFAPGTRSDAFTTTFTGGSQTWLLNGATATASSRSHRC